MPGNVFLRFKEEVVRSRHWDFPHDRKETIERWKSECGGNWFFCILVVTIDDTHDNREKAKWGQPRTKVFGKISRDKQRVKSIVL